MAARRCTPGLTTVSRLGRASKQARHGLASLGIDMAVLLKPQMAIDGAALDQFAMRPEIDDLAAVEHEGLVAIDQRGETVRDDHHRASARNALEIGVDQRLALRIERRGRFVEDHQLGIDDQRARDGEALALAAREVGRAFLDPGLVTLRQDAR